MLVFQLQRNTLNVFCLTAFLSHSLHPPSSSPSLHTKLFFKINIPSFHYHCTSFIHAGQACRTDWRRPYGLQTLQMPVPGCHTHLFIDVSCSILKAVCFFLSGLWIGNPLQGLLVLTWASLIPGYTVFLTCFSCSHYLSVIIPFHPWWIDIWSIFRWHLYLLSVCHFTRLKGRRLFLHATFSIPLIFQSTQ